ncbi:MAG: hypothetical protein WD872_15735 [Pirellulaceae bacterium]
MSDETWKLVTEYPVNQYRCGVRAGDRVRLRADIVVRYPDETPTGELWRAGEVWTVLPGDLEVPPAVWLRQANGERCTWSDDHDFLRTFEIL